MSSKDSVAAESVAAEFAARVSAQEEATLSPLAARSYPARRAHPEEDCALRTPYQRDRDRIVHSKAFRRLTHKTQVFVAPEGDHYRTRLTHTLEVTAVSRTVARALRLNEDLTEAIGLGHDLGHPPFGHIGEEVLDRCLRERFGGGFRHYEHSLRVVEELEPAPRGVLEREAELEPARGVVREVREATAVGRETEAGVGAGAEAEMGARPRGLNLTEQVRDGIARHSGRAEQPHTLEGRIVRVMDRVAYINHDIDDALRAGLLSEGELPAGPIAVLGDSGSARIDALVHDLVEHSERAGDIVQGHEAGEAMLQLRKFMFERVYLGPAVRAEHERIAGVVQALFEHYVAHPELLPSPGGSDGGGERDTVGDGALAGRGAGAGGVGGAGGTGEGEEADLAQRVTDYIAGMTDRYCIREYTALRVPRAFAR